MPVIVKRTGWTALALAVALLALGGRQASAQLQFSSADGSSSLKLGVLGQIQGQDIGNDANNAKEKDLYFRRLRLIGLFKLGDKLSVYFDTDDPNLGKGTGAGPKNSATSMYIQDFVVTYSFAHEFQIDGGEILTPNSYNHLQSAGTLLPLDYGAFSFNETEALGSNVGRDYGAQLRGYLANDHLEYRFGVFQGVRGIDDVNSFRYAGRLSLYVFGAETGLFYRGTSLGKIQTMEFGGSFDRQKDYSSYNGDFFWDQPVGNGDGFTVQFDYTTLDGGTFIDIPKQHTLLGELGYYLGAIKTQPFFQYSEEKFNNDVAPDQKHYTFGLGYYFVGNTSNLKLAYSRISVENAPQNFSQLQLQYQVFIW
jgi:hypothetical protein